MRSKEKLRLLLCFAVALLPLLPSVGGVRAFAAASEAGGDAPEEPRSIFVGDILALGLATKVFSPAELRDKFTDFEIIDIKETADGYLLSIRTFVPGEYTVALGSTQVIIDVKSTLDEIEREELFEGDSSTAASGLAIPWRILFCAAAGVFAVFCALLLIRALRKKRTKALGPLEVFLSEADALSAADENYFVDLTRCFKEYIEALFGRRIIGKTSSEIIDELRDLHKLDALLPEIGGWLYECDRFKFAGISVKVSEKRDHYGRLVDISKTINLKSEDNG